MIVETINQKIAEALKAKDEIRLSVLRMLSSSLNYEYIAKRHKLSEEEEIAVVRREIKKRKEAIEAYQKAGNLERVERETQELNILKEFLPKEISDEELNQLIEESISKLGAKTLQDTGKVMAEVMAKVKGRVEGENVAQLVRSKLS